jgi:hypothetical protein
VRLARQTRRAAGGVREPGRVRSAYGKSLLRRRGELIERSFAHCYETGGMRRCHLRGRQNILKRQLIHVGAFNLSLILRKLLGAGTPRELKNRAGGDGWATFALSAVPDDDPFACPGTCCRCWSARQRPLQAATKEVLTTGSRATTTVPLPLELISKVPPNCRSLSRIPLIPTPAVPPESKASRFSDGMPLPLSSTSRLTWLSERLIRILATGLSE